MQDSQHRTDHTNKCASPKKRGPFRSDLSGSRGAVFISPQMEKCSSPLLYWHVTTTNSQISKKMQVERIKDTVNHLCHTRLCQIVSGVF